MELSQVVTKAPVSILTSDDLGKRITVIYKNVEATGTLNSLTHRYDWDGKAKKTGIVLKEEKWEWSEHSIPTADTLFYYSPKEEEVATD